MSAVLSFGFLTNSMVLLVLVQFSNQQSSWRELNFSSPANGGNGWTIFGNSATTTSLQVTQCFDKSTFPHCITHLYFCPDNKRKLL